MSIVGILLGFCIALLVAPPAALWLRPLSELCDGCGSSSNSAALVAPIRSRAAPSWGFAGHPSHRQQQPVVIALKSVQKLMERCGLQSVTDAFVFDTDEARQNYEEYVRMGSDDGDRHILQRASDAWRLAGGHDASKRDNMAMFAFAITGPILCSACGVTAFSEKCAHPHYSKYYHAFDAHLLADQNDYSCPKQ